LAESLVEPAATDRLELEGKSVGTEKENHRLAILFSTDSVVARITEEFTQTVC
jgi:hypothetical protein